MADTRTISFRDGRFEALAWTRGSGPPLLYLHGWSGLAEWPAFLDPLAERFQVVAPQHPGYGTSTGLESLDDFLDLTLYYLDFIEAAGLERPSILGHSLGAAIAAEMAALSPCSVGKLALAAAMGLWDDENPVADIFAMTDSQRREAAWTFVEDAQRRGLVTVPETPEERRTATLERTRSLMVAAKFLFPIPDRGLKKRIHRIKAPTLLVWGMDDRIVPRVYGRLFRERIPGATLVEVPGAGHEVLHEASEIVVRPILEFLEG